MKELEREDIEIYNLIHKEKKRQKDSAKWCKKEEKDRGLSIWGSKLGVGGQLGVRFR